MKAFLSTLERSERFEHENDLRWRVCVWRSKCGSLKIEYFPHKVYRWETVSGSHVRKMIIDLDTLARILINVNDPVYTEWLKNNKNVESEP